ncbi:conserved hypothetical protein [Gluconacetobacter diazotrophicus PA1 5]|uniref:Uncharacterized protein n=3 Tax=Gluconacetobacter diazotrophicus TaxID=33996 RepID=A9HH96_GLUDA|nr:DUF1217 domain-containing protein [Gluconacetobacter diazotrophicus]ACI53174.1 conserved hypothetical protein [Gluconacetobacter diazotrophicus PA1 5]MBB2156075.1 DUF1217 domain-containing protein [Gluconacetobacter diazotrophicus]TWB10452.1 uncharacterized protein DUF1217 [Gluconacetobacter diazotrophicus]CAP55610.1 conserved hypothetical protein [Gluconacetobacter diazotrophicus PA1 5]
MSGSISGTSPISLYLAAEKDEETAAANYTKENPTIQNEVTSFEESASSITSAADLMSNKNYTAEQVVLGAYNLSSISGETALVKDLLTQDPTSSKSVAKSSGNATWLAFADAFSTWGQNGGSASASPFTSDTISSIVTKFEESQYESSTANQNSGVGNALYFTRNMTSSMSLADIMSNATLLKVVETVSGFNPDQFGALDYPEQVRLLQNKVDLSDFSTPEGVQKYAEQYLAMLQINPQTPDTPITMMDLFGGGTNSNGILALFGSSSSSSSSGSPELSMF